MGPGSKPGMNGAAGFQKGLSCESCHSKYTLIMKDFIKTVSQSCRQALSEEFQKKNYSRWYYLPAQESANMIPDQKDEPSQIWLFHVVLFSTDVKTILDCGTVDCRSLKNNGTSETQTVTRAIISEFLLLDHTSIKAVRGFNHSTEWTTIKVLHMPTFNNG